MSRGVDEEDDDVARSRDVRAALVRERRLDLDAVADGGGRVGADRHLGRADGKGMARSVTGDGAVKLESELAHRCERDRPFAGLHPGGVVWNAPLSEIRRGSTSKCELAAKPESFVLRPRGDCEMVLVRAPANPELGAHTKAVDDRHTQDDLPRVPGAFAPSERGSEDMRTGQIAKCPRVGRRRQRLPGLHRRVGGCDACRDECDDDH